MTAEATDVLIVGAGPYGLSLAAQLRHRGVDTRIVGRPMKFWRDMPVNMNLKSLAFATNIYVPQAGHTFPEWCRKQGLEDFEPCTMESFAAYGMQMQERFLPDLDDDHVTRVSTTPRGFHAALEGGRSITARRVVLATGLSYLARMPDVVRGLPPELATHSSHHTDYSRFKDKHVAIIGGGASAIEAGAFVQEAGGSADVLVRQSRVVFHDRTPRDRPLMDRIREPMTVLGAGRKHWVLQHFPAALYFLPESVRTGFVQRYLGPSSPWWIKDRVLGKVPLHVSSQVVAAEAVGGRVRLTVRTGDGCDRVLDADHVIAGTGFDSDMSRLPYLDQTLAGQVRRTLRAPRLSMKFETSVKGLHVIGPMSAMSFGPLFRFVAGAEFTVQSLADHLGGPLARAQNVARRLATTVVRRA